MIVRNPLDTLLGYFALRLCYNLLQSFRVLVSNLHNFVMLVEMLFHTVLDMAVKMLPQVVADAFVKQYYMILNKCPENAHKFYGESSLLGWPGPDGVVTPVTTLSGISDKILSSDYKDCSVEVKTVDAQESQDGGVIVVVTGSLTEKDDVKKNFLQTFFLAKQEKGFFVLNDILRFLGACGSTTNTAPTMQSSGNISDSPTSSPVKAADENGKIKEESDLPISKDTVAKVLLLKLPLLLVKKSHQLLHGIKCKSAFCCSASNARVPSVVVPASNVALKVSYASMVAKETAVTSPKPAIVTPKASVSLGNGAPKVPTLNDVVSKAIASSFKIAAKLPTGGNSTPDASANADVRGIYIGRLPYNITKQGIVDVLKQFGPVRRYSDSVQIRRHEDGFCCGFVEFESADSARRAVEVHHVKFGEKEAYIAYKKSSGNRGNDGGSRSPTRGGFRNGNFRGWENEATHNGRSQNEDKGRAKGAQRSRSSGRDRLN
ncbi:hypothetical protein DH2020_032309 [Rehmannia glutinosa]|uniref:G3BP-like protein n=1 Tax=Rehmannia glutinosa TaxID=99300 RepID=A0ABR0VHZ9_REHGL